MTNRKGPGMARQTRRRLVSFVLAVLTALGVCLQAGFAAQAPIQPRQHMPGAPPSLVSRPIDQQPFYAELQTTARSWSDVVLGQVVGDSPAATLLNFYAVMADVGRRADELGQQASLQPGFWSSAERREQINDTNLLFALAVKALDSSGFPESVRHDMADEAAIQLKLVLDYVFTHTLTPIEVPDLVRMKELNDQRTTPTDSWRIPGTAITLTSELDGDPENQIYFFSSETVQSIGKMYAEIKDMPVVSQAFSTPLFYRDFIYTPGYLVPPKWYLMLPLALRSWLEVPIYDQTLFQVAMAALVIALLAFCLVWLFGQLAVTYCDESVEDQEAIWLRDSLAWRRALVVLPALPLTRLSEFIVDDVINFTGFPLVISTYAFYIVWYVTAGIFVFFLFDALGRSASEFVARIRGVPSPLRLQRVSNFVMPLCRVLGGVAFVCLVYRLLILLGLPPSTVLAFSAVPGLAIGLGASKLLGNLFAGLSIQTDRPLRIGDFCRVGEHLGFVKKIGLRSLEIETLDSRVTVPNSVADEATIVNYSLHNSNAVHAPSQGMDLRLAVPPDFSPFQLEELLRQVRRELNSYSWLLQSLATLESDQQDAMLLVVHGIVSLHGWDPYLKMREQLMISLQECIERAELSEMDVAVSYATSSQSLQRMPGLLERVVAIDKQLEFGACRFEQIADFSYRFVLEFTSLHSVHDDFEDSIHDLNRRIIQLMNEEGIEIPFPTQTLNLFRG